MFLASLVLTSNHFCFAIAALKKKFLFTHQKTPPQPEQSPVFFGSLVMSNHTVELPLPPCLSSLGEINCKEHVQMGKGLRGKHIRFTCLVA